MDIFFLNADKVTPDLRINAPARVITFVFEKQADANRFAIRRFTSVDQVGKGFLKFLCDKTFGGESKCAQVQLGSLLLIKNLADQLERDRSHLKDALKVEIVGLKGCGWFFHIQGGNVVNLSRKNKKNLKKFAQIKNFI